MNGATARKPARATSGNQGPFAFADGDQLVVHVADGASVLQRSGRQSNSRHYAASPNG